MWLTQNHTVQSPSGGTCCPAVSRQPTGINSSGLITATDSYLALGDIHFRWLVGLRHRCQRGRPWGNLTGWTFQLNEGQFQQAIYDAECPRGWSYTAVHLLPLVNPASSPFLPQMVIPNKYYMSNSVSASASRKPNLQQYIPFNF